MVNRTCLLEDSGSLFREQWMRRGHQNSVKINGVFLLVHLQISLFSRDTVGPTRSKASCETKVKRGAGVKMTATFWFASECHVLLILHWLTIEHIGSIPSTLKTKATLTGSLLMIPCGISGVAISSSKNGDT
jgi:hypothetical protein